MFLFYLFNNNHKPNTYNIFGLLAQIHSYEAAQSKLNAKIGRKITQTNYCLNRPLFLQNSNLSVKNEVLTRG